MERRVIAEVMREEGLQSADIPQEPEVNPEILEQIRGSKRYFRCKAFASFESHDGCGNSWKSAHAWCVLDLKEQCIVHHWCQGCQQCEGKSSPSYDEQSVRRMAKFAVKVCLIRLGRREDDRSAAFDLSDLERVLQGPHDETRCEMCQTLGHRCWV